MLLSRAVRASWSIAAVLLVATLGRIARADNTAANEGAFQHLRALQDIASASGGNRAAGTSGYDRSAEYVAERLKEAGYVVRLEKFEFPFFEERASPVLVTSTPGGAQMPASAGVVRTLVRTACWRNLASTIMVAARPRCSKRRCDWCGSRPEHAVACVSPSGEQRSRASWARVNMLTVCPKMTVVTSCSTSISTWSARPTSCASFRALLRPIMPRLPLRDANSSLIFANIA